MKVYNFLPVKVPAVAPIRAPTTVPTPFLLLFFKKILYKKFISYQEILRFQ